MAMGPLVEVVRVLNRMEPREFRAFILIANEFQTTFLATLSCYEKNIATAFLHLKAEEVCHLRNHNVSDSLEARIISSWSPSRRLARYLGSCRPYVDFSSHPTSASAASSLISTGSPLSPREIPRHLTQDPTLFDLIILEPEQARATSGLTPAVIELITRVCNIMGAPQTADLSSVGASFNAASQNGMRMVNGNSAVGGDQNGFVNYSGFVQTTRDGSFSAVPVGQQVTSGPIIGPGLGMNESGIAGTPAGWHFARGQPQTIPPEHMMGGEHLWKHQNQYQQQLQVPVLPQQMYPQLLQPIQLPMTQPMPQPSMPQLPMTQPGLNPMSMPQGTMPMQTQMMGPMPPHLTVQQQPPPLPPQQPQQHHNTQTMMNQQGQQQFEFQFNQQKIADYNPRQLHHEQQAAARAQSQAQVTPQAQVTVDVHSRMNVQQLPSSEMQYSPALLSGPFHNTPMVIPDALPTSDPSVILGQTAQVPVSKEDFPLNIPTNFGTTALYGESNIGLPPNPEGFEEALTTQGQHQQKQNQSRSKGKGTMLRVGSVAMTLTEISQAGIVQCHTSKEVGTMSETRIASSVSVSVPAMTGVETQEAVSISQTHDIYEFNDSPVKDFFSARPINGSGSGLVPVSEPPGPRVVEIEENNEEIERKQDSDEKEEENENGENGKEECKQDNHFDVTPQTRAPRNSLQSQLVTSPAGVSLQNMPMTSGPSHSFDTPTTIPSSNNTDFQPSFHIPSSPAQAQMQRQRSVMRTRQNSALAVGSSPSGSQCSAGTSQNISQPRASPSRVSPKTTVNQEFIFADNNSTQPMFHAFSAQSSGQMGSGENIFVVNMPNTQGGKPGVASFSEQDKGASNEASNGNGRNGVPSVMETVTPQSMAYVEDGATGSVQHTPTVQQAPVQQSITIEQTSTRQPGVQQTSVTRTSVRQSQKTPIHPISLKLARQPEQSQQNLQLQQPRQQPVFPQKVTLAMDREQYLALHNGDPETLQFARDQAKIQMWNQQGSPSRPRPSTTTFISIPTTPKPVSISAPPALNINTTTTTPMGPSSTPTEMNMRRQSMQHIQVPSMNQPVTSGVMVNHPQLRDHFVPQPQMQPTPQQFALQESFQENQSSGPELHVQAQEQLYAYAVKHSKMVRQASSFSRENQLRVEAHLQAAQAHVRGPLEPPEHLQRQMQELQGKCPGTSGPTRMPGANSTVTIQPPAQMLTALPMPQQQRSSVSSATPYSGIRAATATAATAAIYPVISAGMSAGGQPSAIPLMPEGPGLQLYMDPSMVEKKSRTLSEREAADGEAVQPQVKRRMTDSNLVGVGMVSNLNPNLTPNPAPNPVGFQAVVQQQIIAPITQADNDQLRRLAQVRLNTQAQNQARAQAQAQMQNWGMPGPSVPMPIQIQTPMPMNMNMNMNMDMNVNLSVGGIGQMGPQIGAPVQVMGQGDSRRASLMHVGASGEHQHQQHQMMMNGRGMEYGGYESADGTTVAWTEWVSE